MINENTEKRWQLFDNKEMEIIQECLKNWRMEDLGLGNATGTLEAEIAEELERRNGIVHSFQELSEESDDAFGICGEVLRDNRKIGGELIDCRLIKGHEGDHRRNGFRW